MKCKFNDRVILDIDRDELAALSNSLSEATYGFQRSEFDVTPSKDAMRLLNHLSDVFDASHQEDAVCVRIDVSQAQLLIDSIKSAIAEFGSSEFHARIGCTVQEAQQMFKCLEHCQLPNGGMA